MWVRSKEASLTYLQMMKITALSNSLCELHDVVKDVMKIEYATMFTSAHKQFVAGKPNLVFHCLSVHSLAVVRISDRIVSILSNVHTSSCVIEVEITTNGVDKFWHKTLNPMLGSLTSPHQLPMWDRSNSLATKAQVI